MNNTGSNCFRSFNVARSCVRPGPGNGTVAIRHLFEHQIYLLSSFDVKSCPGMHSSGQKCLSRLTCTYLHAVATLVIRARTEILTA